MHSFTSSEGPRLVRITVPCAQTMVAIEIHHQKRHKGPRVSRGLLMLSRPPSLERRSVLCHSLVVDFIVRTLPLQW